MNWPDDFINKIICGDCLEVMKEMPDKSIDAVVTDPPYGLEFMGKKWDRLWDNRRETDERTFGSNKCGIRNNPQYKAGLQAQLWHTQWLTEAYRVLKPGGSMLVMGGTRTSHRLACAIEDSEFIIKDTLMWLYGSGFPKAQDLGKMIDKRMGKQGKFIKENPNARPNSQPNYSLDGKSKNFSINVSPITEPESNLAKHWDGFKVGGIKPAYEPIVWAVKPPEGSYVDNVLKWGVGAVNVDECRIGSESTQINRKEKSAELGYHGKGSQPNITGSTKGRFPANVILSHHPECVQMGMKKVNANRWGKGDRRQNKGDKTEFKFRSKSPINTKGYENPDGYEQVESWDCHPDCAVRLLDEQSGNLQSGANPERRNSAKTKTCFGEFEGQKNCISYRGKDNGGASRFFYCAKASKVERGKDNKHPTVKPIALFMWLIQLVTREGQIILDPFIGSGTTMLASQGCNRSCVGIEKEQDYCKIAEERLAQGVL